MKICHPLFVLSVDYSIRIGTQSRTVDLEPIEAPRLLSMGLEIWGAGSLARAYRKMQDPVRGVASRITHRQTSKDLARLADIRDRWNLNGMHAGTRRQEEFLSACPNRHDYASASAFLSSVGLLVDRGYRYGSEWLVEPLPDGLEAEISQIIERLQADTGA